MTKLAINYIRWMIKAMITDERNRMRLLNFIWQIESEIALARAVEVNHGQAASHR